MREAQISPGRPLAQSGLFGKCRPATVGGFVGRCMWPRRQTVKEQTTMRLFALENWPVWFICVEMLAIATTCVASREYRVENRLTIPFLLGGWLLGLLHTMAIHPFSDAGTGGLGASLGSTAIALLLLVGPYSTGGLGAGAVKLGMGLCAWTGAFYGLWDSVLIFLGSFVASIAVGGFISLIWHLRSGRHLVLPFPVPLAVTATAYLLWRHW